MAISNFHSRTCVDAGFFSSNDGIYTGSIAERPSDSSYPDYEWTPILFDQDHLVAGSFGINAWGTGPNLDNFDDSLKIATYDDAYLWYIAGCNFRLDQYDISDLEHIVFIGCTRDQVGAFLEGIKYSYNQGAHSLDIDALIAAGEVYATGFEDGTYDVQAFVNHFQAIQTALA